jgi:hypothetical protein
MGYLVKNLADMNWQVDIVTSNDLREENFKSLVGNNTIIRVDTGEDLIPPTLMGRIWRMVNLKRRFFSNKKPYVKAALSLHQNYDLLLVSTSWAIYILQAGAEVSKKTGIPFIVDLRDIHEQNPLVKSNYTGIKKLVDVYFNLNFKNAILRARNNELVKAAAIISITPWHVNILSKYHSNVKCIYNGYDEETYKPEVNLSTSRFIITYTGSINYIELRDPDLLFKAVLRLKENDIISSDLFKIDFYIPNRDIEMVKNTSVFHNISEFVDFHSYVETSKVPGLLNNSVIVLLLTNLSSDTGPKGVISTKFFEYLAVERPILCVRSDESIMEEAIKISNAGVSARTVEEAYDFIYEKWQEWKEKGHTTVNVNQDYKKQFSRKAQASQFVEIFEKVIQDHEA